mgnify:FL=1
MLNIVVKRVKKSLGDDSSKWRWGDLHKIQFKHSLNKFDDWKELHLGPDEIGGSPTTLGMAMHMGKGPGKTEEDEIPCRVYHGPAYRLVVDLNDPEHAKFVIAGGNGGRVDSKFCLNHYATWLKGNYFTLNFNREEINESFIEIPSPGIDMSERPSWLREMFSKDVDQFEKPQADWRDKIINVTHSFKSPTLIFSHFMVINVLVGYLE